MDRTKDGAIRVGAVAGIAIGLHYSWFFVFGLVAWSLASGYFPMRDPQWSATTDWLLAAITTSLFFASVLSHELAHSLVARSRGIPVQSITLFVFGGVASLRREPKSATTEFLMAIAGPAASLVLAAVFGLAWLVSSGVGSWATAVTYHLATINVALALFNLIPGFPLDGGRVLRSAVWGLTGRFLLATSLATSLGRTVGYLLLFAGLIIAFAGSWGSGVWLIFIGWFLSNAAESGYQRALLSDALSGVPVTQLMSTEYDSVSPCLALAELMRDPGVQKRSVLVTVNGKLVGMVTPKTLQRVGPGRGAKATVADVMTPAARLATVGLGDDALAVLALVADGDADQLPVVDDGGCVLGLVTRSSLFDFLGLRRDRSH